MRRSTFHRLTPRNHRRDCGKGLVDPALHAGRPKSGRAPFLVSSARKPALSKAEGLDSTNADCSGFALSLRADPGRDREGHDFQSCREVHTKKEPGFSPPLISAKQDRGIGRPSDKAANNSLFHSLIVTVDLAIDSPKIRSLASTGNRRLTGNAQVLYRAEFDR
jgi:hypothetical protein